MKWLKYVLHAAVLIGLGIAAYRYLNGGEVLEAFTNFNYIFAPFMLLLSAAYLALKGWRFVFLMAPVSDLPWGVTFRGYVAGQAATLLPGGVAARAGLMKQAGVPVSKSSAPVAFSSILDQVVFIVCSLLAALFFPGARTAALVLLGIVAVLALIFFIPATRRWFAKAADWVAGKFNIEEKWHDFLKAMREVATPKLMLITLGITVLAFALKVVTLDLTLRGLGFSLSYATLFLAYILPTMLGRLSGLPAGVGVTEAGMVGFLTSTADIDTNTAAAAVALFRVATILFQALLGALVYAFAWGGEKEGVGDTAADEPEDDPKDEPGAKQAQPEATGA